MTLTNTEKFSNTGFETDLSSWNTGAQPDSISGLQLWLKADAITGLNDGDSVTTWTDSSGNSNNATQSTAANKPTYKTNILNGQPVVRFDGSNDKLIGGTNLVAQTIFLVVEPDTSPGCCMNAFGGTNYGTTKLIRMNGGSASWRAPQTAINGDDFVDASGSHFVNGANTANHTLGQFAIVSIQRSNSVSYGANPYVISPAANEYWDGDFAEIIIYNSALSNQNRENIEGYLAGKYGISTTSSNLTTSRDTATTYNSSVGSAKTTAPSYAVNLTQSVNVGDTNTYNLSTYAYTDGSAVTSSDIELYYNGSTVSTTYTSVGGGWYQLTGTVTGANASRQYGVQVKANKTVYVDNFSLNNYASSGTLTSSIFDTEFTAGAAWGTLTYSATTPSNTSVSVKARTSNSSSMTGATAFSSCTAITSASDISSNSCVTDSHRYIQYELTLANTDSVSTPTFQDVSTTFATYDSTAPSISLTALATDPNSDTTPTLSGTATESVGTVSNVQFQMDATSGSWTACTADDGSFDEATETFSCTPSALSDGSHTMYVRATDSNSNTTSSANASTDTFTIDATNPVSIDLDSPGGDSYTNSERPTFKWKATTDATAGLSKYVLEIDNPSIGSSQPSGDFTIDSIPTSRTTDYDTNKYTIKYENFSDSDSTNNYISVYTKSHSDWGSSENDGKLREGKVSWKVKAVDNASNETSSSRTLFVDRTNPNVEFSQINNLSTSEESKATSEVTGTGSSDGVRRYSTTDKTPTIFGKITDSLSGGDSSQTQDENGPKVASGPKQVDIKVEKKEGIGYKLITLYTINMDKPWYTCDGKELSDNKKQKCDKYLPFEYTPKEDLSLREYRITISGKDKADNGSSETTLTLNVTTLAQITKQSTSEESKPTSEVSKPEIGKPDQEGNITIPTEIPKPNALEKATSVIPDLIGNLYKSGTSWIPTFVGMTRDVVTGVGNGIGFTFNTIGSGLAFTGEKIGQGFNIAGKGFAFAKDKTGESLVYIGHGIQTTTNNVGQGIGNTGKTIGDRYNQLANNAPGVTKTILTGIGNGVSTATSTTVTITQNTVTTIGNATHTIATATSTTAKNAGSAASNAASAIASATQNTVNSTKEGISNVAFEVGEKTQDVSDVAGFAIVKFGYIFVNEPTKIANVQVATLSPTSVKVTWETNHPANGKVNYGLDRTYPFGQQTEKRTTHHEFILTNLQPDTTYLFEVMSHNKNYVYDANREFKTLPVE